MLHHSHWYQYPLGAPTTYLCIQNIATLHILHLLEHVHGFSGGKFMAAINNVPSMCIVVWQLLPYMEYAEYYIAQPMLCLLNWMLDSAVVSLYIIQLV